ncbi:hypothetical protein JG687_00005293 [Phytophthora cactorum]|uniref:DUSP domain-containing protein n=1 Tax=Phytophthora cactorum TaxID=29920 RepID=A0A8T1UQY4_9STRA|nr:hypothetical protein JG687_00005293 [Phytophthora cactorum]
MAPSYRLGDAWFVVSCGWWQRVVERGDTPIDSRIRNADIVDAKRSCRCCSRSILQPNLLEDVDYRLVSERVWSALSMEFGYDWSVRREVVTMGRRLGVDVYPSGLEERATGHGHIPNSEAPAAAVQTPPSSPVREEWTAEKLEQWRSELKLEQIVDALDTDSRWYEARIVDITDARVKVHYRGWSVKWDEWLSRTSPRLMPSHSKVSNWRKFQANDEVQVGEARPGKKRMLWRDGRASIKRHSCSMAALEPDSEGSRGDAGASWALPDWEEYSEAASSSFIGDWSDVEADVSLDTASSVASTEHQRVYRIQRARGGFLEEKQRGLRELHSLYTRRRLEESSQGLSSVRSSANWLQPEPCASPRVPEKPLSPVSKQEEKLVENELLAQQSEISAELQAVRRQLRDFQDKWKKTVEAKAGETESSEASTVQSSWSSPIPVKQECKAAQEIAVQTERDDRENAVTQWLLLLTQKLETLTKKYAHEPTQNFQASMAYLTGVSGSNNDAWKLSEESREVNNDSGEADEAPTLSSWHVGRELKAAVPLEVAEQFLELEHAIACVSTAVEQRERRQMTNFDRAIQQVQGFHQERMQRVVDESLEELKLVRGRYKKKESLLEDELRAANKEIEQWKQTAVEAEHRKKLDRESLEFQLSAAKEQHDHICRRYEDGLAQLKTKLEVVRAERKQVVSQHRDTHEVIAQAKEGAVALERQCQALKKQQERAKELHDREDKQGLVETIEKLKTSQQADIKELEARVRGEIEQHEIPEKLVSLEKQHQEAVSAMDRRALPFCSERSKSQNASQNFCLVLETFTNEPISATDEAPPALDSSPFTSIGGAVASHSIATKLHIFLPLALQSTSWQCIISSNTPVIDEP